MRLFTLLLIGCVSVQATAADINVPADQATIQAAINVAVSGVDEVVVAPGNYPELINLLGKAITVRSSGGPDVTTIDGTGLGGSVISCITGEVNDTIIQGFTITGGIGTVSGTNLVGGGLFVDGAGPMVIDCTFTSMTTALGGAAYFADNFAFAFESVLLDCRFLNNTATKIGSGGGAMINVVAKVKLYNCLFRGNTGDLGGAIIASTGMVTATNCVFYENTALSAGSVVHNLGTIGFRSCILWNNLPAGSPITFLNSAGLLYNDIQFVSGSGTGTINVDPKFVDPANGDFHLQTISPCINAGEPTLSAPIVFDLDGDDRVQQCRVDIGIDETPLFLNDCNGNGIADSCDLFDATSFDCNFNLIPDECETDCNGNGIDDACDLANGTSPDFNNNGIPDECEPDCNNNGFPDFIDIAFGFSLDVNLNGIPDECECPADIDVSGLVNVTDLLALLAAWGPNPGHPADFTGPGDVPDGQVTVTDLLALLAAWGACP